ncbi:MAG: acyl-CoA dehydrogenase family protein [Chloroflexota bacterium]|nr:acyl-CoA dehydrogenase family protein [Chloroflexota bacterium]
MDFRFNPQEEQWRKEVRDFFEREVTSELLEQLEAKGEEHSPELYQKLTQKGWLGLSWPKEYGGKGCGIIEMCIFYEEMSRAQAPIQDVYRHSIAYFGSELIALGTEEQQKHFLPRLARGEITCCRGFTGPEAGSDLANVQLRAVEDGDYYRLNGEKTFMLAHYTDHIVALTRTDPNAIPKHRGLTMFIVDLESPGVKMRPMWTLGGHKRSQVFFDDVMVPKGNLLGKLNRGFYQAMEDLNQERSGAFQIVLLEKYFHNLIQFVKKSRRNGQPLGQIPETRQRLADLTTGIQVAWLISRYTLWRQSQGMSTDKEAAMTKLYVSELSQRLARVAMDTIGPLSLLEYSGQSKEWTPLMGQFPWLYRNCSMETIGGGTSEIQRHVIAMRGLQLPRTKGM